jgi:hypothetical protein
MDGHGVLVLACWIRNTIRTVMMVVSVLIRSCHVSEKLKMGPVIAHATTTPTASTNAVAEPACRVAAPAKRSKA